MTGALGAQDIGELLRELAPQVLGALVRRYGQFGACEDAVQEAMLEAVASWPARGVPESPKGWLLTAASRRLMFSYGYESWGKTRRSTPPSSS